LSTWERLAGLDVELDDVRLERTSMDVSSGFTRVTTTVVLSGQGHSGRGEDVTYEAHDHEWFPELTLRGRMTLAELSARLDDLRLFAEGGPRWSASSDYRRYAIESAALDLALRQNAASLGGAVGRAYSPVRFVISTRLDPALWLAVDPQLEFKLDPTSDWGPEQMASLAATGHVRCLDFKAYYTGTAVDQEPDPTLYRAVAELFPEAILEDPALTPATLAALDGAQRRLSFDAPIHSLADVDALPVAVRWLNMKPSRFGTLERLFACIDACEERGIRMYGGGQFELGYGRGQIQALASLFYPDGPNDVAPVGYNAPEPTAGLPRSPLIRPERPVGFSWTV